MGGRGSDVEVMAIGVVIEPMRWRDGIVMKLGWKLD